MQQAVQLNFFNSAMNEMQRQFLDILYHDSKHRNGYFLNAQYRPTIRETWTANIDSLESDMDSTDVYVAINSFHGKSRRSSNVHTINAIFFDLDFHEPCSNNELDERINNTHDLILSAADRGVLPRPTMITKSGRGLGLFYVLEKSIANTPNTQKSIQFWKHVSNGLANMIEHVLTDAFYRSDQVYALLELDWKVVADVSRVCRLPGTTNSKVHRICMLEDVYEVNGQPVYYNLSELAKFIPNPEKKDKPAVRSAGGNVVDFSAYKTSPMLYRRLEKLTRAQKIFMNKTGNRELLCFYYYNTACQLYAPLEAQAMLYEFNDNFSMPIEAYELDNIVRSVSSATDQNGDIKGYYKLTDQYIAEKLGLEQMVKLGELTQDQIDYIGFGRASKQLQRALQKSENRRKKEERNTQILNYIIENPGEKYADIAGIFGVSIRTINRIVKENDAYRYNVDSATSTSELDVEPDNIAIDLNMPKSAPVSNGVCVYTRRGNILYVFSAFSSGGLLVFPMSYVCFGSVGG